MPLRKFDRSMWISPLEFGDDRGLLIDATGIRVPMHLFMQIGTQNLVAVEELRIEGQYGMTVRSLVWRDSDLRGIFKARQIVLFAPVHQAFSDLFRSALSD
jgi:hypothetical protein